MSFLSLGVRPGFVVALAIPLTLAIVFAIMLVLGIDMQRISLGALIIALALMVDDAMTTTDATLHAAGRRRRQADGVDVRLQDLRRGDARRHAGDDRGLRADRLRPRARAGEYCFTLFAVVTIALLVSWLVAVIFAPLLSLFILKVPKPGPPPEPPRVVRWYRSLPGGGAARALADHRWSTLAVFVGSILLLPLIPRQFFPASDRPELLVDLTPAAERVDLRERHGRDAVRRDARRAIPTSSAGAPMSARGRSASTCRSTCSWPTRSSPRR